jgi:hypothetical protein
MADVIDPKNNKVVWRGVVTDAISGIDQSEKQTDQVKSTARKRVIA